METITAGCCVVYDNLNANDVWKIIRDFGEIKWYAPTGLTCETKGKGIGMIRIIRTEDGKLKLDERLLGFSEEEKTLCYSVYSINGVDSTYLATIHVDEVHKNKGRIRYFCMEHVPKEKSEEIKKKLDQLAKKHQKVFSGFKK